MPAWYTIFEVQMHTLLFIFTTASTPLTVTVILSFFTSLPRHSSPNISDNMSRTHSWKCDLSTFITATEAKSIKTSVSNPVKDITYLVYSWVSNKKVIFESLGDWLHHFSTFFLWFWLLLYPQYHRHDSISVHVVNRTGVPLKVHLINFHTHNQEIGGACWYENTKTTYGPSWTTDGQLRIELISMLTNADHKIMSSGLNKTMPAPRSQAAPDRHFIIYAISSNTTYILYWPPGQSS